MMATTVTSNIPDSSAILASEDQAVPTTVVVTLDNGGTALAGNETIEATNLLGNVTVQPTGAQRVTLLQGDHTKGTVTFTMTVPQSGAGQVGFTGQAAGVQGQEAQPSGIFAWTAENANLATFQMKTVETDYIIQEWDGNGQQPFFPVVVQPLSTSGNPYIGMKLGFYGTNFEVYVEGWDKLTEVYVTSTQDIGSQIQLKGVGPNRKYTGHDFTTTAGGISFFIAPKEEAPASLSYHTWCYSLEQDIPGGSLNIIPPYTKGDPTLGTPGFEGSDGLNIDPDQGDEVVAEIPPYTRSNPGDVIALCITPDGQETIVTPPKVLSALKKVGGNDGYWLYPVSASCFPCDISCRVSFIQIEAQSGNPAYSDVTTITNVGSSSPAPDPNLDRPLLAPKVYRSNDTDDTPNMDQEIPSTQGWVSVPNVSPNGITVVVPPNQGNLSGNNISGVAILYGIIGGRPISTKMIDLPQVSYNDAGASWHIRRSDLMFIDDDNNGDGHCWIYYSSDDNLLSQVWDAHLDTMSAHTPHSQ
jgi:hypothetical protein